MLPGVYVACKLQLLGMLLGFYFCQGELHRSPLCLHSGRTFCPRFHPPAPSACMRLFFAALRLQIASLQVALAKKKKKRRSPGKMLKKVGCQAGC